MGTTELRADAQFVLDCEVDDCDAVIFDGKDDVRAGEDFVAAALRNARHILATTADDDDEPPTMERLTPLGFGESRVHPFGLPLGDGLRLEAYLSDGLPWEISAWVTSYGSGPQRTHSIEIPQPRTMRDVRALLAALGVGR